MMDWTMAASKRDAVIAAAKDEKQRIHAIIRTLESEMAEIRKYKGVDGSWNTRAFQAAYRAADDRYRAVSEVAQREYERATATRG